MAHPALTATVGLASGVLAGAFGIGGGLLTTPAIRLLLGYPALVAVGTPLPVIVPTALAGALGHARKGLVDVRAAAIMGATGAGTAVLGARLAAWAGGPFVLVATAVLIGWIAVDMLRRPGPGAEPDAEASDAPVARVAVWRAASIGVVAGLYSGFLGLGGGFVIVPALARWLRWPVKRAIGTSLATITLLAIPGSVTHYLLGNVDVRLALLLAVGAVPGALVGARLTDSASERHVSIAFAVFLVVAAVALAAGELAALLP